MSYFDFFCNKSKFSEKIDDICGTCYTMCPKDEEELRSKNKLIHVLEVNGPTKKLVKCYSRSAADSTMAVPHLLRPYLVLKDTLQYLIFEVLKRDDVPTAILYDFVNDRLRAIRQDMTIQRLPPKQCATLLEPMIRFYVYFGYRLQNFPFKDYDPVLNKKYLLECMKWFLHCCDCIEQDTKVAMVDLARCFEALNVNESVYDRNLVESLYILCNLTDIHPILRYLSLSKDLKSNSSLQLAFKIALANVKGDYINIFRLSDNLCPLTYYALNLYLPELQKHALEVMSHGYNSKQLLTVPSGVLQEWLRFGSKEEALAACRHYGLETKGDAIRFAKADFKKDVALHQTTPLDRHLNLEEIFTYRTCKDY